MSVPQHHQSDMETIMYEYRVLDQRAIFIMEHECPYQG